MTGVNHGQNVTILNMIQASHAATNVLTTTHASHFETNLHFDHKKCQPSCNVFTTIHASHAYTKVWNVLHASHAETKN
jgi:hypothetical protein